MKGCLATIGGITVLAVIIAALASGSSSTSSTTPATTRAAPAAPTATSTASKPTRAASKPTPAATTKTCGSTQTNAHASCPFAENVYSSYSAYVDGHHSAPESIEAYSPVTQHTYTLSCAVRGAVTAGATVVCSEGDASIQFGFPHEAESHTSSEEDEVGSTSHATDEQFCEAHHCIGNFTTEDGTVVECADGTFSHAGGIYGACSYHGGEAGGGGGQYSEEEGKGEGESSRE